MYWSIALQDLFLRGRAINKGGGFESDELDAMNLVHAYLKQFHTNLSSDIRQRQATIA